MTGSEKMVSTAAASLAAPEIIGTRPVRPDGADKVSTYVQPLAALLALKSGRPVRLAMSRAETFEATGPAMGTYIKLKVGATLEGKLTTVVAWYACEVGAFPGSSVGAVPRCLFGAYDVPNGQIDGFEVLTNKPKSGAYQAPGSTQATFAAELLIDEICEQIHMDPLEFRLKNVASEGCRTLIGAVHPKVGYRETMKAAQVHEHYEAPLGGPNRGRGL
ncbi:MAG: molybdopterin-dependent oxidoreductase, partial [Dehalococcoidia bacterium]|nr:molybdopterin-dependent oxidoreductase [Dehalococcoidia bacterium]